MTHENLLTKIKEVVAEVFYGLSEEVSTLKKEQNGSGMYGLDFMIDEKGTVKLLEITVSPDCRRAQRDYPGFWNDVLGLMVYGEKNETFDRVF
jgi:glutathione synthase/RimK-type ligase-like ATP-grasp enzyme